MSDRENPQAEAENEAQALAAKMAKMRERLTALNAMTPLQAALSYAEHGYPVMPAKLDGTKKVPLIKNWVARATTDPKQIEQWWTKWSDALVCIQMGCRSGLVVLDEDYRPTLGKDGRVIATEMEADGRIVPTMVAITPDQGRHRYYVLTNEQRQDGMLKKATPLVVNGVPLPGLDFIAEGGYVVAPPSRLPDGRQYLFDVQASALPAVLPAFLSDLQFVRQNVFSFKAAKQSQDGSAWAAAALDAEVKLVADAQPGSRNSTLNTAAYRLGTLVGAGMLARVGVEDALLKAAEACGYTREHGVRDAKAVIKAGLDAGIKSPRQNVPPHARTRPAETVIEAAWDEGLVKRKGMPLSNLANVLHVLSNEPSWRDCITYDEFRAEVMVQGPLPVKLDGVQVPGPFPRRLADSDCAYAVRWFSQMGAMHSISTSMMNEALKAFAEVERRSHSVRDWLETLEWDGIPRIEGYQGATTDDGDIEPARLNFLAHYYGAKDGEYSRLISRIFMLQAVARIFEPGCKADYTLVLEGLQGIMKSTSLRALFGTQWFGDSLPNIESKDVYTYMSGLWIIEIPEFSLKGRTEKDAIKAFLTRQNSKVRKSYARNEVDLPRQCVFVITTNDAEYFTDETGNRRYLPVEVGAGNSKVVRIDELTADREQLWAEAVQLYKLGVQYWPTYEEEARLFVPVQRSKMIADPWLPKIASWVRSQPDLKEGTDVPHKVRTTDILSTLLEVKVEHHNAILSRRVATCMKFLGWELHRKTFERYWLRGPTAEPYRPVHDRVDRTANEEFENENDND